MTTHNHNHFKYNFSVVLATIFASIAIPAFCQVCDMKDIFGMGLLGSAEGTLFDEPITMRTGEFREICATCGTRLTCNGCCSCGVCEKHNLQATNELTEETT